MILRLVMNWQLERRHVLATAGGDSQPPALMKLLKMICNYKYVVYVHQKRRNPNVNGVFLASVGHGQ